MNELRLGVGGIAFALSSGDPSLKLEARGAARRFLAAAGEPDVRMTASWANGHDPAPVPGEKLFDAGSLWSLYSHEGGYLFQFSAPRYGPAPYKTARFNADFTAGEVRLNAACFPPSEPHYPLEYPLDELLMVNLLARGRGVEVHACGVRDADGRGYLFLGESGAGKTTTAQMWMKHAGVQVLSDDRVVLRLRDGRVWMYGTPWHGEGELSCAASNPVERIFFLARGEKNGVAPLRKAEVVTRLMACSFAPFFSAEGLEFTLSFLERVAGGVPCMEFRFVPDGGAVGFVRGQERSG